MLVFLRQGKHTMLIGLAIIGSVALLLTAVGYVVLRRRQPVRPDRRSDDANQTVNWQRHNETGTDWRQRP
jgi:amino acid transporter